MSALFGCYHVPAVCVKRLKPSLRRRRYTDQFDDDVDFRIVDYKIAIGHQFNSPCMMPSARSTLRTTAIGTHRIVQRDA